MDVRDVLGAQVDLSCRCLLFELVGNCDLLLGRTPANSWRLLWLWRIRLNLLRLTLVDKVALACDRGLSYADVLV